MYSLELPRDVREWSTEADDGSLMLQDPFRKDEPYLPDAPPSWFRGDRVMDTGFRNIREHLGKAGFQMGVWVSYPHEAFAGTTDDEDHRERGDFAEDLGPYSEDDFARGMNGNPDESFEEFISNQEVVCYVRDGVSPHDDMRELRDARTSGFMPMPTGNGFHDRIRNAVVAADVEAFQVGMSSELPRPDQDYARSKLGLMVLAAQDAQQRYGYESDVTTVAWTHVDSVAEWIRAGHTGYFAGGYVQQREAEGAPIDTTGLVLPSRQIDTARKLYVSGVPEMFHELSGTDVRFDPATEFQEVVMSKGYLPTDWRMQPPGTRY